MEEVIISFGATESKKDNRTFSSENVKSTMISNVPESYKLDLDFHALNDLSNQGKKGICTKCASRNGEEFQSKDGIRRSEDWGYLIQKLYIDGNLTEGSSIFSALHCAYKYGTPSKAIQAKYPLKVDGTYAEYIDSFLNLYGGKIPKAIMDDAANNKIKGYAKLTSIDPLTIAKEISSGNMLICRFTVGENTYTNINGKVDWSHKGINPLRAPKRIEGGHAWVISEYEGLDENQKLRGLNSWGRNWGDNGYFDCVFSTQKPYFTEAWIIIPNDSNYLFHNDLTMGATGPDVVALQKLMVEKKFLVMPKNVAYGYFGGLTRSAVIKYQVKYGIKPSAGYFGPLTRAHINKNQ